ncbi:probable gluconokinase isoform X4 [Chionomys nivalis]|uniref:probable gluconokinase isoform X4 n=1 Tax=Chionomys nivalis TaxID=269649 RepID=UPI00259AB274|nr:probable gluconokinase isoform X4 [Chionomys nivalis]
MEAPAVLLVMGVSGSGKSTVGTLLASKLGWKFYDADDYHSEENRMKMGRGVPLSDQRCGLGTACHSSLFSPEENVQRHLDTGKKRWAPEKRRVRRGKAGRPTVPGGLSQRLV